MTLSSSILPTRRRNTKPPKFKQYQFITTKVEVRATKANDEGKSFFLAPFSKEAQRRSGASDARETKTQKHSHSQKDFSLVSEPGANQKPLRPTSSDKTCRSDVYRPLAPCSTRDKASNNAPDPNLKQLAPGSKPFGPLVSTGERAPNRKDRQVTLFYLLIFLVPFIVNI